VAEFKPGNLKTVQGDMLKLTSDNGKVTVNDANVIQSDVDADNGVIHVIDTVLLASALVMVVWSHQYPFAQNWLTAKLFALIVYIGLGTVALKRGNTKRVRAAAFIGALLVFAYIVKVAVTRQVV